MSFYVAGSHTKAMPSKKRKKRNQVLNNLPKVNLDELVTFRRFQNGCFAAASFPTIDLSICGLLCAKNISLISEL